MEKTESQKRSIQTRTFRRKPVSLSPDQLVRVRPFQPKNLLPLVIEPAVDGLNLNHWAENNRSLLESQLLKHGGILFRNFRLNTAAEFERFIQATANGELLSYQDGSSPRSQVKDHIYTSTDHPANQSIFLHSELSYAYTWPLKIFFFCVTPALQGGETPIADIRNVFQRLDPKIKERFCQKQVLYVRNFGDGFGLPWQTVFQTSDRVVVEQYCHHNGIQAEWKDGGKRLRTCQIRPAIATHPRTKQSVWFNHAAFFHVSTLESTVRQALLAEFPAADLPYNTYYGDGLTIEPSVLEEIRQAYRQETVTFPWQAGDILMLDNMLTAHGRNPYVGPRKVLAGMAEPLSSKDI